MNEKELENAAQAVRDGLDLHLPLWGKLIIFASKFFPIPGWLKSLLPIAIGLIAKLPREAKDEVQQAARNSIRQGNADALVPIFKKHCSGIGCPPDLVGDRARERG